MELELEFRLSTHIFSVIAQNHYVLINKARFLLLLFSNHIFDLLLYTGTLDENIVCILLRDLFKEHLLCTKVFYSYVHELNKTP